MHHWGSKSSKDTLVKLMGQEEKSVNAFSHTLYKILVIQPQKLLTWTLKFFLIEVGKGKDIKVNEIVFYHKRLSQVSKTPDRASL